MRPPAHFTQLHHARYLFVAAQPPIPGIPRDPEFPAQSSHPPPGHTCPDHKTDSLFLQVHLLPRHRNPPCKDPPSAVQSVRDVLLLSVRHVLLPYSVPGPYRRSAASRIFRGGLVVLRRREAIAVTRTEVRARRSRHRGIPGRW